MWRWLLLVLIVGLLVAGGVTLDQWGPPLWTFLGANKDQLGALKAVFAVVGTTVATLAALWAFLRGRKPEPASPPKSSPPAAEAPTPAAPSLRAEHRSVAIGGDLKSSVVITGDGTTESSSPER